MHKQTLSARAASVAAGLVISLSGFAVLATQAMAQTMSPDSARSPMPPDTARSPMPPDTARSPMPPDTAQRSAQSPGVPTK